jgi:asparagine synthase (glutamine-hydrolysing)
MCGISGFFEIQPTKLLNKLQNMSNAIRHRGPDQYGYYQSRPKNLYIAHQRLSIIDLTDAGQQPMSSSCGLFVIAFNGEIYNFEELRTELQLTYRVSWRGHSDTEVLVECIAKWGIDKTLIKLNGMFALAVYDVKNNNLVLARDRFGEKPLYIYSSANSFAFASELKPLEIFTSDLTINSSAVDAQLRYSYIPAPYSIYNEVFKMLPGHYLEIDLDKYKAFSFRDAKPYWQVRDAIEIGIKNQSQFKSIDDAIVETENVLSKSVRQRMVSDVPLGAFLSGGIDSTCITALMQANSSQKVKTFSIGFHDKNYNEAQHAKTVAGILGTDHYEMYLNPSDMLDYVPKLADIYDEPFADSSQLPTLMVSKFAKEHVTVALTGDAGDEVYCGYNRYAHGPKIINRLGKIPSFIRSGVSHVGSSISPQFYNMAFEKLSLLSSKLKKYKRVGDNIHKLARVIDFDDEADLYKKLIMTWPEIAVTDEVYDIATDIYESFSFKGISLSEKMMWQDAIGYMQNDILTKVDRASMAVSLETRVPFLDNDVYQHAWSLPIEFKLYKGMTKYPLRQIISKYIPSEVMNRPKSGFGVPIDSWLRNELKGWAEDLLSDSSLDCLGILDKNKIKHLWKTHQSGKVNEQYALWNVLMLQQWASKRYL